MAYGEWATEATWRDFVRLAQLTLALPPFALDDWATGNPVPGANGSGYHSTVLARRLISALVMVRQLMSNMREWREEVATAANHYILHRRKSPLLPDAKRYVYEWLLRAANVIAASIVDEATQEGKDPLAMELGRRGGLKGGKARAKKMTAKERSEAARKAAWARWAKG